MTSVMIDFETYGNGPDAVVIQIGACYFNPMTGEIGKTLKINVDAGSSVEYGGKIDASTVDWWLQQSEDARRSILAHPRIDAREAFVKLNDFLGGAEEIWSHATFDFVILQETLKRMNIKPHFHYRASRDIRTLTSFSTKTLGVTTRNGVAHDALDDCKFQVAYCSPVIQEKRR